VPPDALQAIAVAADGDVRRGLTLLEIAADIAQAEGGQVGDATLRQVLADRTRRFDKGGDAFYDQISALHKCVRSSNPDAAVYLALLAVGALYFLVLAVSRRWWERPAGPFAGTALDAVVDGLLRAAVILAIAAVAAWSLPGRSGVDAVAASLVDDGRLTVLLLGFLVIGLVGPVAEEVIFRRLVIEDLRGFGAPIAVGVSSALFSAAHLSPARFVYYLAVGVALGRLYLRRGLLASTVAHVAMNVGILVIALLVLHGGSSRVTVDGLELTLPDGFHAVGNQPPGTWAAVGPDQTAIEVSSFPVPTGAVFDPDAAATALEVAPPVGGLQVDRGSAHVRLTPFGNGVEATLQGGGRAGVVVLAVDDGTVRTFSAHSRSAPAARQALEELLASIDDGG